MTDDEAAWLAGLPIPEDDGAAAHLLGRELPAIDLVDVHGTSRSIRGRGSKLVMFVYPATGVPGRDPAIDPAPGWDRIPGAPGCTMQTLGYRDHLDHFAALGFEVVGVSGQASAEQAAFAARNHVSFAMLSDPEFALAAELDLPTFTVGDRRFYKRLAAVVVDNRIVYVAYPVFPPNANAEQVLGWLEAQGGAF